MTDKKATTIDEQLNLLKSRNMIITDEEKAKENLLDIGYYRLGFYWYPFEISHNPHIFEEGTLFEYAIKLYYFDYDLRNILLKYITRIEINFRTTIIYHISNHFKEDPFWYINRDNFNMSNRVWDNYISKVSEINNEKIIKRDLDKYNRNNAPVWKSLEFLTFGTIIIIFKHLKDIHLKCKIANLYGIRKTSAFESYIDTIKQLRNLSAHGKVLFDLSLKQAIDGHGPLGDLAINKTNFHGAYCVFCYMLGQVSVNRVTNMKSEILQAYDRIPYQKLHDVIVKESGLCKEDITKNQK